MPLIQHRSFYLYALRVFHTDKVKVSLYLELLQSSERPTTIPICLSVLMATSHGYNLSSQIARQMVAIRVMPNLHNRLREIDLEYREPRQNGEVAQRQTMASSIRKKRSDNKM